MKGLFLFTVLTLTAIVSVYYSLSLLDSIVHVSLYSYGLEFSYDWATPYWMTLKVVQALLGFIAVLTVVNALYLYKTHAYAELKLPKMPKIEAEPKLARAEAEPRVSRNELEYRKPKIEIKKPEIKMTLSEKSTVCTPTITPTIAPTTASTIEPQQTTVPPGMVRCGHCGKIFAQPLRMLDFHEDRPRMVSICPFCNEVIQAAPRPA
jgi:hypothetical protein